ncbi:phage tail terminator family protein [Paenibacillus ferrarius]|uniref:phage tail terminator family protein n=1 Tax=Paenibacillus ferrarius TaxID=1469647 RepID=UPI003D2CFF5D
MAGIAACLGETVVGVPVYTEEPGSQESHLFVALTSSEQIGGLDRRSKRVMQFCISFYPEPVSLTKKADCRGVAEQLFEPLGNIGTGGQPFRLHTMKYEIAEDVLRFYVTADVHVMREKAAHPQTMKLEQEVRV